MCRTRPTRCRQCIRRRGRCVCSSRSASKPTASTKEKGRLSPALFFVGPPWPAAQRRKAISPPPTPVSYPIRPTRRVVDNTLEACRYLGTLAALAPDVPILWLRRDPLDCAWSAYRTFFIHGMPWS
ncbi:sulfotransferase [Sphingomonas bacterium]|uniref:sulfotransferase n=1 Tax=Sphingomonas bacterium TaxID=1895847 RepID=UPI0026112587|nr:sulfotransferase [Sphingomonas bacterium]